MAIVFDGKQWAKEKEVRLAREVVKFKQETGIAPRLISFLVGDNPASKLYVSLKKKAAQRVGIKLEIKNFSSDADPSSIVQAIELKNGEPGIQGIMIQMPLPEELRIMNAIDPKKDVDCLTSKNLDLLKKGKPRFLPATLKAILNILKFGKIKLAGKKILIVGAKGFVGKPLFDYLRGLGLKVVGVDKETKDLGIVTRRADILISTTGTPNLIKKEMVKKGVVVIDVGSPKGDVDFEQVKKIASFITPVPGGVGPLTVISLLENVLAAAGG